jgi:hypothetical protein
MSNWGFVALAFGLTWAVLVGYTLVVLNRSRRARAALVAATGVPAHARPRGLPEPVLETVTLTAVEVAR